MKLLNSSIDLNSLKNALLINEHGAEFLINGFDFENIAKNSIEKTFKEELTRNLKR